jgi:hypothetical protein
VETALAGTTPYEAPTLAWSGELAEVDSVVWWVVLVGFAYALALAYAGYCTSRGGNPDISFGWRGFKVTCYR